MPRGTYYIRVRNLAWGTYFLPFSVQRTTWPT